MGIKNKSKIKGKLEKAYPIVISLIATVVSFAFIDAETFVNQESFDSVLSAVIACTSILVGFAGVLLAIMASMKDGIFFKTIQKLNKNELLKKVFSSPVIAGLILLIFSLFLLMRSEFFAESASLLIRVSLALWLGLFAYVLMSFYRIFNIMVKAIFANETLNKKQRVAMSESEEQELLLSVRETKAS